MPDPQLRSPKRPKVLVVDDQEVNLELMEAHLVPEGYEVCFATSGPEAIEKCQHEQPDIVLLDIMMPGMDGNEVCRRLRSLPGNETLPVVMITALEDEEENRVRSIEAGADDFLEKPVSKRELLARLRGLLQKRQMYHHLSEENARLQQARRMSYELRHLILHDISTPISELDLALNLALKRAKDHQQRRLLQWMSFSTEKLNRLTVDLLDLDRLENDQFPLKQCAVDLNALVRTELEHLRNHPDAQARQLKRSLDPALPLVQADPNLIARVLANLLNNALKYTPPGSEIRVSTHAFPEHIEVSVCDDGPGIPPEEREKIFEKHYQASHRHEIQRKGQGLGLTFCKLAIEAHGGRIWVDGEKGAHFHFTLPRSEMPPER